MKRLAVACVVVLAAVAWTENRQGIHPRPAVSDYAVSQQQTGLSIGAYQLSKTEVHNSFATDLERGYVVVEVGVFPGSSAVDVQRSAFALRIPGTTTMVRPASPETIAAALQKGSTKPPGRDVTFFPTVGVGYETGGRDATGQHVGGVSTSVGTGVGVGGNGKQQPASTPADRSTMKTELQDKILPEGTLSKPAAGYLYFPLTTKEKDKVAYELEYRADGQKFVLALPPPKP